MTNAASRLGRALLYLVIACPFAWASAAFIEGEVDPLLWPSTDRLGALVGLAALWIVVSCIAEGESE